MKSLVKCDFCDQDFLKENFEINRGNNHHFCSPKCYHEYDRKHHLRMRDYSGQTIYGYQIISIHSIGYRHIKYNVICPCGAHRTMFIADLNPTGKCYCWKSKDPKKICLDQIYQRYKSTSRHRKNISFNLSKDEVYSLVQQNCYYCDQPPKQIITVAKKYKLAYNGIDRLNNQRGYQFDNCVPCCWMCNQAKRNYGFQEFKEWISKVNDNLKKKDNQ